MAQFFHGWMEKQSVTQSGSKRNPATRLRLESLEDRVVLNATTAPVTFAVIGDYGVASQDEFYIKSLMGTPPDEAKVANLVNSWSPEFVISVGDNNYLCGEGGDPSVGQVLVNMNDFLSGHPNTSSQMLLDYALNTLSPVAGTATVTSTNGLVIEVSDISYQPDKGPLAPKMLVGKFVGTDEKHSLDFIQNITFSGNSAQITVNYAHALEPGAVLTFYATNYQFTALDGLSHIDRNISQYFNDFIYPLVDTSPGFNFTGSPTDTNRFFPTPGNHDWADLESEGGLDPDHDRGCLLMAERANNLDPYLAYFQGLNATNSPGFQMGYTIDTQGIKTPLDKPYFYSFQTGITSDGKPLLEFFSFDSDPVDPYLNTATPQKPILTVEDVLASPEGKWLKDAMTHSTALWQIPYFHHTPHNSSTRPGYQSGAWMDLPFQQWGADAVLNGHVHNYERLQVPSNPGVSNSPSIPYFVNGVGGASLKNFSNNPKSAYSKVQYKDFHGAMKVVATEDRINFQFININGEVIDQYFVSAPILATGSGRGSSQTVKIFNANNKTEMASIRPYAEGFQGGVSVATGDVNGDGSPDIITGAGPGGGPHVKIFSGQNQEEIGSFFAFDENFRGGVSIGTTDIDGDGVLEIVAGAGPGGGPHVKIFNGKNLAELSSFFAFDENFRGGVNVSMADLDGDGILDIVTGAGPGGGPHVKVFNGATGAVISQWFAYAEDFTGGVFVAMGDIGNDGKFEVVTGAGQGGSPVVAVFDPFTGAQQLQFLAYAEAFQGGVRVGVNDNNGDGVLDLVTGAGPGGAPHVKVFNFPQLDLLFEFFNGPVDDTGGVNVS